MFAAPSGWEPATDDSDVWYFRGDSSQSVSDTEEPPALFAGLTLPSAEEAFKSAWPLAAMWPVLYVFYQGELALGLDV